MNAWIDVKERLPEEKPCDGGTVSEPVMVRYSSGEEREDWLLNGQWVLYCEKSSTIGYPVAWRAIA
ncbi:MAG: hypothetical protein IJ822_04740 [Pyramidobacter sp.]|nr:hypothetical protein [Pyramidobacter sp.]